MNSRSSKPAESHFRRYSVNAIYQIGSQILPLLAGALAIPFVYKHIGHSEFGVFTVALSILGLFSLLDLGLGRATVRFLAGAFARGDPITAASVLIHSVILLGTFSILSCGALIFSVPVVSAHWFPGSTVDQVTLRECLYWLAAAMPAAGLTSVFRAVLESRERFLLISIVQAIQGVATYLVPLMLLVVTNDVRVLIAGAVMCRGVAFVAFTTAAASAWEGKFPWHEIRGRNQQEFRRFSLWLVISNVIGSVLVYCDRVILVKMFGLQVVAFYNVPLELLGRLMIIVNSGATVLFPALSRSASQNFSLEEVYISLTSLLAAFAGIGFLAISILTPMALQLWLGVEFRNHSTALVQILVIGLAFQTLNVFALATLNARGFARPITIMHLLETPIYLYSLYYFGKRFGLSGVSCVWSSRIAVEYACFVGFHSHVGMRGRTLHRVVGALIAASNVIPLVVFMLSRNVFLAIGTSVFFGSVSIFWCKSTFPITTRYSEADRDHVTRGV